MLQLDLCSFLFLAMAFYEKQLPVGPYTIYPARLGKLWSSGSSRKLGQNSSLNWELWGPMKGWQQHMGCALECPTPKNLVRENPHSCQWAVCRKTLLSGAISQAPRHRSLSEPTHREYRSLMPIKTSCPWGSSIRFMKPCYDNTVYTKHAILWIENPDSTVRVIKENRFPHHMENEVGIRGLLWAQNVAVTDTAASYPLTHSHTGLWLFCHTMLLNSQEQTFLYFWRKKNQNVWGPLPGASNVVSHVIPFHLQILPGEIEAIQEIKQPMFIKLKEYNTCMCVCLCVCVRVWILSLFW